MILVDTNIPLRIAQVGHPVLQAVLDEMAHAGIVQTISKQT
jgi:hypothetical protein